MQASEIAALAQELASIRSLVGLVKETYGCRCEVDEVGRIVPLIQETYAIRQVRTAPCQ